MWAAAFPACIVVIYLGGLFALSQAGRRRSPLFETPFARRLIYALGCCVNWGFGTGLAMTSLGGTGSETIFVWLVPPLVFAVSRRLIRKMIALTRQRGVTTVADFASAAYGKTLAVGAIIATCLFFASIPLHATLLKAICLSFSALLGEEQPPNLPGLTQNFCIFLACALAIFTIATGTRRPCKGGHQRGISLVVAAETILRILAVAVMFVYALSAISGGLSGLVTSVFQNQRAHDLLSAWPHVPMITLALMGCGGLLFVPSQFQMTVIENIDTRDIGPATWIFPAVSIGMVLLSIPLLLTGLLDSPVSNVERIEAYSLPLLAHSGFIKAAGLFAGYSAITSWILVSTTTVASVVSNDLVIPAFLHPWMRRRFREDGNFAARVLMIRRLTILASFFLSCLCCVSFDQPALDVAMKLSIGLFAQAVPACTFAMILTNPPARCAVLSMIAGLLAWAYTMALPLAAPPGAFGHLFIDGPFGIAWLSPVNFFGLHVEPFTDGVIWSLGANFTVFAASWAWPARSRPLNSGSLMASLAPLRETSVDAFFQRGGKVTLAALRNTVIQYLGEQPAISAFNDYLNGRSLVFDPLREADSFDLAFGENLLATAIGNATAHLVVTLFLQRQALAWPRASGSSSVKLTKKSESNEAGLLSETVLTPKHGMVLFDPDLRLVAWNITELKKLSSTADFLEIGLTLREVVERSVKAGFYGPDDKDQRIEERCAALLDTSRIKRYVLMSGRIFECRSLLLPDGFLSLHYIDITDDVRAERTLEAENETLERRVRERTEQLLRLNEDLIKAKAEAEEANISKTRFLAAASHDLLQPLNAARLYATSLKERIRARTPGDDSLALALNVEDSLEAVEDILTALLDISHLDAGATKPETTAFPINDIFRQVQLEFEPTSREKGLAVTFVASSLPIVSDKRLLRRVLRNFLSNAIKYTPEGRVLVGVRRRGTQARIEVWDTGIGIPKSKQRSIFREFERLPDAVQTAPGAGLGLSIVKRLGRLLNHEIQVRSRPGLGSVFAVIVPRAATVPAANIYMPAAATGRQGTLEGLEVAVLDNETSILMGMSALLGGWGCRVTIGHSLDALRAVLGEANITPDVIIADYRLTHEDGISAIDALRSQYGPAHAILITADRSPQLRDIVQSKNIRFLNKPVKPAILRSMLTQWRLVKHAAE